MSSFWKKHCTEKIFIDISPNLNLKPTTYNLQPTTYNLQPTTYNLQPTTYNLSVVMKSLF
jgi:hypothetical protein